MPPLCREEKGVKVRLEVGPKDAEQSMCTVARSQVKAGEVAHKVPGVTIGTALLPVVAELLKMKDKDVPMGDWSKYEKQKAARAAGDAAAAAKASGDAPSGCDFHPLFAVYLRRLGVILGVILTPCLPFCCAVWVQISPLVCRLFAARTPVVLHVSIGSRYTCLVPCGFE